MLSCSPVLAAYRAAANIDLDSIEESTITDIIPLLYFTVADVELLVIDRISDYYLLKKSTEQIQLLDSLCSTNFDLLWKEGFAEYKKRSHLGQSATRNPYACNDFELQASTEAKLKLIIQQLCHLLMESCTNDCIIRRCCSILESPTLIFEVLPCLVALIIALPQPSLLSDIICGLSAHCSHAARNLVRLLILNFPHLWPAVWKRLLEVIVSADQQNLPTVVASNEGLAVSGARSPLLRDCRASRALATLRYVITFMPQTECILDHCISLRCLPEFVLQLALSLHRSGGDDLLGFFRRVFFDEGRDTCEWFGSYLKTLPDTDQSLADEVNNRLLSICLPLLSDSKTVIPRDKLVLALEFLRVVAALRGFADFPFTLEVRQSILQLIIRPTSVNERAVNFICYALAFSVGMRSCFMDANTAPFPSAENSSVESEEHVVTWLHRLLNRQDVFHAALRPSSSGAAPHSYSQLLLLLALLFHTNQQSAIRELIAEVLGVDAPCLARNISASRKLFTQKVFTEQLIAAQAAHVPVTVNLNAQMAGHLPIHCVHQLLRSHTFSKNRVQIKGWIYRQICESVRPLHPLLPELVEAYVASCLNFTPRAGVATSLPFTESELLHQFSAPVAGPAACICSPAGLPASAASPVSNNDTRHDLTPQLLFLYYLLFIYDQELMTRTTEIERRQQTQAVSLFSDKLWDAVPVTFLLQYARSHMSDYRKFYPRLLQLVTNHLPHLTVGELMIQDELLLDPFWQSTYTTSLRQSPNPPGPEASNFPDISHSPATSSMNSTLPSPTELAAALDTVISSDAEAKTVAVRRVICMLHQLYAVTRARNVSSTSSFPDDSLSSSSYFRLLLPYVDCLATKMPLALLQDASICGNRRFGRICCSLWRSLHTVMPQRLGVLTIGALTSAQTAIGTAPIPGYIAPERLTRRDLLTDPVERIVMGVDRRVYRCPPVLHIVLRILECNLLASRSFWAHRVADRHFPAPPPSALAEASIVTVPPPVQSSPPSLLPITSSTKPTAAPLPTLSAQCTAANPISPKDLTKGLKRKKSSSSSSPPSMGDSLPVKISTAGPDCTVPATVGVSQGLLPDLPHRSVPPPLSETSDPLRRSSVSRTSTPQHQQVQQPPALLASDEECDRLRAALVLSQDATVVQLLLEFCLPCKEEKELKSEITELREVQNIICTFIHYLFIAEPSLANVVFWQTYPRSIIPVAVRSIPSIHICMDSVIDVFRLGGNFESMVFCLDFVSHLALHYNIRALLDRTAYLVEGMHQIFTSIVSVEELPPLLLACLPSFCRIACAFPSLSPRIATIMLTSLSMIVNAWDTVTKGHERTAACLLQSLRKPICSAADSDAEAMNMLEEASDYPDLSEMNISDQFKLACTRTLRMFNKMVTLASAQRRLYVEPQADSLV